MRDAGPVPVRPSPSIGRLAYTYWDLSCQRHKLLRAMRGLRLYGFGSGGESLGWIDLEIELAQDALAEARADLVFRRNAERRSARSREL